MLEAQSYTEIRKKVISDNERGRYTLFDYLRTASRLPSEQLVMLTDIEDETLRRQFIRMASACDPEEFRKRPRIWKKATISIR
jgi:hypothetical protein